MALHHLTVTITTTGTSQQLQTAHQACWYVRIENEANNGALAIGDRNVTSTDYGTLLPAATTPAASVIYQAVGNAEMDLNSIWVNGTATNKLHVTYIT